MLEGGRMLPRIGIVNASTEANDHGGLGCGDAIAFGDRGLRPRGWPVFDRRQHSANGCGIPDVEGIQYSRLCSARSSALFSRSRAMPAWRPAVPSVFVCLTLERIDHPPVRHASNWRRSSTRSPSTQRSVILLLSHRKNAALA